jgi:DNA repair photolyase
LDEKALSDDLGKGNVIFVGSSTDMFADAVPTEWISRVLSLCNFRIGNTYLFQTKNPHRFLEFLDKFPPNTILGTTIETNYEYLSSRAPSAMDRMLVFTSDYLKNFPKMVSIEPVMDFDLPVLSSWMYRIRPKFISIGADSKDSGLSEPDAEKLKLFIGEMQKLTEVKIKNNLSRLVLAGAIEAVK